MQQSNIIEYWTEKATAESPEDFRRALVSNEE